MDAMRLKLLQVGEPVLRERARELAREEILSAEIQQLIRFMQATLRNAPGVGLAAPQVGVPIQLAIVEDRAEYQKDLSEQVLRERKRRPVPFHVVINPRLTAGDGPQAEFFEGCLSLAGFVGLVPRARKVRVECLDENAQPMALEADGWYARILQHEIDHLNGMLYIDRMHTRSFMSLENYSRYWKECAISTVKTKLAIAP